MQYSCLQTEEALSQKRLDALLISCIGVFISLLFECMVFYYFKSSLFEFKLWDINTVTAADFTVEYTIPKDVWDNFIA